MWPEGWSWSQSDLGWRPGWAWSFSYFRRPPAGYRPWESVRTSWGLSNPGPGGQNPEPKTVPLVSESKVIGPKENLQAACPASSHFVTGLHPQPACSLANPQPHPGFIGPRLLLASGSRPQWSSPSSCSPEHPPILHIPIFLPTNPTGLSKAPFKGHLLCEAFPDCSHSHSSTPHSSLVVLEWGPGACLPIRLAASWAHGPDTV